MMTSDIHTCSYQCDRPACIRAQRDELAARLTQPAASQPDADTVRDAERARLVTAIQSAIDQLRPPKMTPARSEYWKAGARDAITAVKYAMRKSAIDSAIKGEK